MTTPTLFSRVLQSIRGKPRGKRPETKTVMLAWELGQGLGHIHRLLPVATELNARGYRIVFVFKSETDARIIKTTLPKATVLQAPVYFAPPTAPVINPPAYTYADILFRRGYESPETLGELVRLWREIYDDVKPALVICDHSPTAVLAAAGRIPGVHIGSGFATPPVGQRFHVLNAKSIAGASEREGRVLRSINEVRTNDGGVALSHPSELFASAQTITCCLPELDPYHAVRLEPAAGPMGKLPPPQPIGERECIFAYLSSDDARVMPMLQALAEAKVRCSAFVRQSPPEWESVFEGTTVRLFETPQQMEQTLGAASAVLHHGGLSTAEMALAIGRPQFLLPRHLEHTLTANTLEKMGVGLNLAHAKSPPGELIQRYLKRGAYDAAARIAANRIAQRPAENVAAKVLQTCLSQLTK